MAFLKARLGYEPRSAALTTLRARSSSLVPVFRVAAHSARTPIFTNREWGGCWLNGHPMLHVRPTARFMYWHYQQWRASLRDGNSVTPAQVSSIKIKIESLT